MRRAHCTASPLVSHWASSGNRPADRPGKARWEAKPRAPERGGQRASPNGGTFRSRCTQLFPLTPVMTDDSLCIVCGDSQREVLQVQNGVRILADGVDARFDIKTALCASCGLVFTDPQPADELLERFYAQQFRDLFAGDDAARIPGEGIRRDQVAWLRERLGDLGRGAGSSRSAATTASCSSC